MNEFQKEVVLGLMEYKSLDIKKTIAAVKECELNDEYNYIEVDGMEFLIIRNSNIEELFAERIEEMVRDCYLSGRDLPEFIENNIDWDRIVNDCMVDGYGHEFNSYDGSEHSTETFWYFRTN